METKYDHAVHLLLDNWFIAIIVIIAIIIMALPQLRDGLKMFFPQKRYDTFIIEYADEKIICEILSRSYYFDIVKIHATTHKLGVGAERKWLDKFYPGYKNDMQMLKVIQTKNGEKSFDVISINKDNIKKKIYFDITDFFDGASVSVTHDISQYALKKIKKVYKTKK